MNNVLEKIKNTRLLAGIGIVCLILGTMFSYANYSFFGYEYNIALWGYWEGKIVLVLAIANLILIFRDWVEKYIPSLFNTTIGKKLQTINNTKVSLVPTILSVIIVLYLNSRLDISEYGNYGFGFYLLWIGIISLVAYAFVYRKVD